MYLETLKPKLTIVADAVSGVAIELYPAEREGGYRNTNFFCLPHFLFDTKEQKYDVLLQSYLPAHNAN